MSGHTTVVKSGNTLPAVMAREPSYDERTRLIEAQEALTAAEQELTEGVRRARLARDRHIVELLRFGVSAPAIARELGVTRAAVYEMARRARAHGNED